MKLEKLKLNNFEEVCEMSFINHLFIHARFEELLKIQYNRKLPNKPLNVKFKLPIRKGLFWLNV